MEPKHPMQPVVLDAHGVIRFKENKIVRALLDAATKAGDLDMNAQARMGFSPEDRRQFAQLIGYSVSGYGDLSYVDPESCAAADAAAELLRAALPKAGG